MLNTQPTQRKAPSAKSQLVKALSEISREKRRNIGFILGLQGQHNLGSSDARWIAEGIMQAPMATRDRILREVAVCSTLPGQEGIVRVMCNLTFHSFELVQAATRSERGMLNA